jgi:hypothetical protein
MIGGPPTQLEALKRSLDAHPQGMNVAAAEFLLELSLAQQDVHRVNELSSKANEGTLNAAEECELDEYLQFGRLMEFLQLRARRVLQAARTSSTTSL